MLDTTSSTASSLPGAPALPSSHELPGGVIARILPTLSLTFVSYLTIGIPLAIFPLHVHLQLGYGTLLSGLVVTTHSFATVISAPPAVRILEVLGPHRYAVL